MSDIALFEGLVARHQAEIYAYIFRMVRHDGEAQDLCQETFLRAYRAYAGLQGAPNYRAWLYRIATNTTLNALRQRRTRARAVAALAQEQLRSTTGDPAGDLDQRDLLERIADAIAALPLKQRLALTQRRFQGLSYAEIAEALGMSEEAARANVYQAVRKLRAQFARELDEVGL
ncbi:MAG: RNA polymerase sigma factor [Sphaerobacter sp.]|nr:RNA polymerase sigma factor [Sphaerobacter sp.]